MVAQSALAPVSVGFVIAGGYVLATTAESDEKTGRPTTPGAINGGFFRRTEEGEAPRIVIAVGDIRAAMEEVKKCIPLCANCHRILHWVEATEHKRTKKRKKALKNAKKRA